MYSVLVMRIAPLGGRSPEDLTARARIRDTAIACFAEEGFGASFRTIAARAGVSPGLITHHFGSKAALRAECDDEVLERFHAIKSEGLADPGGQLIQRLAVPGEAAVVLVYVLRTVQVGGPTADAFLEGFIEHSRQLMADGVASGLIKASRDEDARTRFITAQTIGAMLVHFLTHPPTTPDRFVASVYDQQQGYTLPMLEIYTEGMLTDRRMLDEYLMYVGDPPRHDAPADAAPAAAGAAPTGD